MSKVVAITGAAGYLGSRLLYQLEKDARVSKIVSIDRQRPKGAFTKVESYVLDINAPLDQILKIHEADVLIHLVFLVDPIHDAERMYQINVGGTENVLDACERAGVKRILMASSGTAYGAHADNPEFLKESDPLRGNPDYQYARDKALMEERCRAYQKKHPECEMIIFRPTVIMGPHVNNFISRYMIKKCVFGVAGYDPYMQFVHEDDIAEIFYRFIHEGQPGAYNVAPEGRLRFSEVARHFRRKIIQLPRGLIYPMTEMAWRLRLKWITEAPSSLLHFLCHPWVLDNSKLKKEIGYHYRRTTAQALDAYIAARVH